MKKSLFIIALSIIFSVSLISCESCSNSGRRVAEKRNADIAKQDSIQNVKKAEESFQSSLIAEGSMWLDGAEGETCPSVDFGISFTGGPTLSLWLINAHNLSDGNDDNQVPLDLALEVRDIVRECSAIEMEKEFSFKKHQNERVEIRFTPTSSDPLDASMRVIDVIKQKKGWFIRLNNWKTS